MSALTNLAEAVHSLSESVDRAVEAIGSHPDNDTEIQTAADEINHLKDRLNDAIGNGSGDSNPEPEPPGQPGVTSARPTRAPGQPARPLNPVRHGQVLPAGQPRLPVPQRR